MKDWRKNKSEIIAKLGKGYNEIRETRERQWWREKEEAYKET